MLVSRTRAAWPVITPPALYALGGIAAIASLRNTLGLASGALLIAAALAIVLLRVLERRAQMQELLERHSSFDPAPSRLAATTDVVRAIMPPRLGHLDIDRQHLGIASRAATLRIAFFHDDEPAELELLVHDLIDAMSHHVQAEIDAMARLGVSRLDADVDADRMQIANAEYDFHLYCTGAMTLKALIERVAGPLATGHLMIRHPSLPCMETALQQLRAAKV